MKKILKSIALPVALLLLFAVSSCDTTNEVDLDNRVDVTYFLGSTSGTINIDEAVQESVDILVAVSSPSNQARSITIEVDPSSTAIASTYEIQQSMLIPANTLQGTINVKGIFDSTISGGTETLILKLAGVDNSQLIDPQGNPYNDTYTIEINRSCSPAPLAPTASFTGDYSMVFIGATNPLAPFNAYEDQTVNITSNSSTERQFSATYLEGLGIGQPATDIIFNFASCASIIVTEDIITNLACAGIPALLGPATTGAGSYDPNDDSTFTIDISEFYQVACGITEPIDFQLVFTKL